jgi:hypothetical protein
MSRSKTAGRSPSSQASRNGPEEALPLPERAGPASGEAGRRANVSICTRIGHEQPPHGVGGGGATVTPQFRLARSKPSSTSCCRTWRIGIRLTPNRSAAPPHAAASRRVLAAEESPRKRFTI